MALLVKNQVRRIPELFFYNDDSLEHIDSIDNALKKTEDPIKNSSLFLKEKKFKMGISFFVSKRYFFSKSKFNIVNFISLIASFVLVVASCSFFIVLSVFSGLKDFGLNYNKAFDPDIKISSTSLSSFTPTESQVLGFRPEMILLLTLKRLKKKFF